MNLSDDRRAAAVIPANAGIQQVSTQDATRSPMGKMVGTVAERRRYLCRQRYIHGSRTGGHCCPRWTGSGVDRGIRTVRGRSSGPGARRFCGSGARRCGPRVPRRRPLRHPPPLLQGRGKQCFISPSAPMTLRSTRRARCTGAVRLSLLPRHPGTANHLQRVHRLREGHYALFENGAITVAPVVEPGFRGNAPRTVRALARRISPLLRESVAAQVDGGRVGCFLSGGTDSSTVAGMLGSRHRRAGADIFDRFRRRRASTKWSSRAIAARHFRHRSSRVLRHARRSGAMHSDARGGL